MNDVNFLVKFFKHEANAGLDISKREADAQGSTEWLEYSQLSADFAQRLESSNDLTAFADYFKTVDFELKTILCETLQQDAERPDLALLLGFNDELEFI